MKILYSSLFIAFVTIVLLATGCKKDKVSPDEPTAIASIRQTQLPSGDELAIYSYIYNDNKQLQLIKKITPVNINSDNGDNDTELKYENGRVSQVITKPSHATATLQKYIYDNKGRIITSQVIPLLYRQTADGTWVPIDDILFVYNYSYDNAGRISEIDEVTVKGRYADQESHYIYEYEYNSQNQLVKLSNYEKGNFPSGGTWVIDGYTDAVEFDPFAIGPLNLASISPFVLKQMGKLPTSMRFYGNDDINGKVLEKKDFTYKINSKKLENINYIYSSFLFTPYTLTYNYDVSY
jgi:hypothetical protein